MRRARLVFGSVFGVLRLALAVFLLWMLVADTSARIARLQLDALPTMDFAAEIAGLRAQGRYGEASMVARAGLEVAPAEQIEAIARESRANEESRNSVLRAARDFGVGAIKGQGTSLESAAGAITADLFVVGDLRDLLIQSGKLAIDGEIDPVITVLSGIGVVTTIAPEVDVAAGVLKAARKAGALSRGFVIELRTLAKGRAIEPLRRILGDAANVVEKFGPAGALRLLRLVDEPADVARIAAFAERTGGGPRAFVALHATGREGLTFLKGAEGAGGAAVGVGARRAEAAHDALLLKAGTKGHAGVSFLRSGAPARMLRPHPVLGLFKAIYKGNAQALVAGALGRFDSVAWWLVPILGTWVVLEAWWLLKRWGVVGAAEARRAGGGAGGED